MFRRLSTRLTIMYGGLFSLVLMILAAASYLAVISYAKSTVQKEMSATASVFNRLWALKSAGLKTNAVLLSRDFGFRSAVATQDLATVGSAFSNLKARVNADAGLVIGPTGQVILGQDFELSGQIQQVLAATDSLDPQTGILATGGRAYNVVAAPILAPDLMGWVVFASKLDAAEMKSLEGLSAIPLHARILTRSIHGPGAGVWRRPAGETELFAPKVLSAFLDSRADPSTAAILDGRRGRLIAVAAPLPSLDSGQKSQLLLSYPLDQALSAYHPLLKILFVFGLIGLCVVVIASLYLARSLTRPILALKAAAGAVQSGDSGHVEASGHDEIADLARAFNTMAVSIKDREKDILYMAKHDLASNLPNRAAAEDYIAGRLAAAGDAFAAQGLLMICVTLDRYTHLRAVWGVAFAHAAIVRLQDVLAEAHPGAFIARIGADSLGVVIAPHPADARSFVEALAGELDRRIDVFDRDFDLNVRLGYFSAQEPDQAAAEILECGQIALDQAQTSKAKIAAFDLEAYAEMADTLLLTDQLHRVLQDHQLLVFYQPKFNYRTQSITAAEALVRWKHPERGWVSPQRFVAIAEETGYIAELTRHVLKTVIADQIALKAQGFEIDISVNYSGRLLTDAAFNAETLAVCQSAQGKICLEITETAVIEDPAVGLAVLEQFSRAGLEISIDDFGTGLSSLAYLKLIPAQELKIDRSFIMEIETGYRDALLVRSTIDLAHGLGMKVTAEGVETPTSIALLAGMGCDLAQGYGIARPMPLDQFAPFLQSFALSVPAPVAEGAAPLAAVKTGDRR